MPRYLVTVEVEGSQEPENDQKLGVELSAGYETKCLLPPCARSPYGIPRRNYLAFGAGTTNRWMQEAPNHSLNLARYGSQRLADPGHRCHCHSEASRRLPQHAG